MTNEIKEKKLKELEDQLTGQKEYHGRMMKELEMVVSNIRTLDGAIQGFKMATQIDEPDAHDPTIVTDIVENT